MPRSIAIASLIGLALLIVGPARAERLGKGRSLVLVGVSGHTGQFVQPAPFRFQSGEVGGHLAYYRFLSDQWTLGISGGYHASRLEVDNPGSLFFGTQTVHTHSFIVRIGGDRYAFIDDDVALYAGPGVFLARGRVRTESPSAGSQGPNTTEVGLNGRIGMYARMGKGTALFGHIGQMLSHASGEDPTGKASWWSSTHEGSVGLAFAF